MSCQDDLVAAKAARHQLMIGKRRVSVRYEGRSVEYTSATLGDLTTYIQALEGECGDTTLAQRGEPRTVVW